jgi:hypothetical protein
MGIAAATLGGGICRGPMGIAAAELGGGMCKGPIGIAAATLGGGMCKGPIGIALAEQAHTINKARKATFRRSNVRERMKTLSRRQKARHKLMQIKANPNCVDTLAQKWYLRRILS